MNLSLATCQVPQKKSTTTCRLKATILQMKTLHLLRPLRRMWRVTLAVLTEDLLQPLTRARQPDTVSMPPCRLLVTCPPGPVAYQSVTWTLRPAGVFRLRFPHPCHCRASIFPRLFSVTSSPSLPAPAGLTGKGRSHSRCRLLQALCQAGVRSRGP